MNGYRTPDIAVSPRVVELGRVAGCGRSVAFGFDVENVGDEPIEVRVSTSCGCATVARPVLSMSGHERVRVPCLLSTVGRSGLVRETIYLDASRESGTQLATRLSIAVAARVFDDVHVVPSRAFATVRDGKCEWKCEIRAPETSWQQLRAECSHATIALHVEPVDDNNVSERRRVEASCSVDIMPRDAFFQLRWHDQTSPFLTMPLLPPQ